MTQDADRGLAPGGGHWITLDMRLRPRPDLVVRQVGDWSMLIDVDNGFTYETNRLGALVWQLLASPVSLRQVCSDVAAAYQMSPDQVAGDVLAFTRDLVRFGLCSVDQGT